MNQYKFDVKLNHKMNDRHKFRYIHNHKYMLALITFIVLLGSCTTSSIKVNIGKPNVYYIPNKQTCTLAEDYIKSNDHLSMFYTTNQDGSNHCNPYLRNLDINLNDQDDTLSLIQYDVDTFGLWMGLNHTYNFTYIKNGVTKDAILSINQQITSTDESMHTFLGNIDLTAGGTTFYIRYDETDKIFRNREYGSENNEMRFIEDLQTKVLDYYNTTLQSALNKEDIETIRQDLIAIIQQSADKTSSDRGNMKTINDVSFDVIYPLINYKTYTGVHSYEIISDYYVIAKEDKYGLVNNNGLLVSDLVHEQPLYLLDDSEIFGHNTGYDDIPFTTFRFGGGHGMGREQIYFDKKLDQFMVASFGHDGPAVHIPLDSEAPQYAQLPLLSYFIVDECKYQDEFYCEFINESSQYGLLSKNATVITELIFDEVMLTNTPLIAVRQGDQWGYVDQTGKLVIDYQYQGIVSVFERLLPYPPKNEMIIAKDKSNKFGVLDMTGTIIVPFEYDHMSFYFDDKIIMKKDGKWSARTFN